MPIKKIKKIYMDYVFINYYLTKIFVSIIKNTYQILTKYLPKNAKNAEIIMKQNETK
jgi:hypothetical protein